MESGNAGTMFFFCGEAEVAMPDEGSLEEHHNHGSVETGGIFERSRQLEIRPMFH